ncbi:hypothetical protein GCM10009776_08340 [Microbacterium deminutum]|uniref:Uncharacterized protein n=1 Tax=Microbacterium deminutum TaxID=344164 RepID=A0ABP5BMA1_9MICO
MADRVAERRAGDQVGQYLALVEGDSIEACDRVSPGGGFDDTAEGREWLAVAGPILQKWLEYVVYLPGLDAPDTISRVNRIRRMTPRSRMGMSGVGSSPVGATSLTLGSGT